MDSKRNNMQHGVSSASDQLSTRLNLVTTLTHGFWLSYKSCCSTKHAPPHLNINFTQNRKPMISNLMKHPWSRELWHHQEVQPSALPHTSKAVKIRNNSLSLSIFTIISWSSQISQFHVHVHKCANSVPGGTPFTPPALKNWSPQGHRFNFKSAKIPETIEGLLYSLRSLKDRHCTFLKDTA
jgi:hypothetical protein